MKQDKQTILVVDDELDIRKMLSIYLTREGYEVIEAPDGPAALTCIENRRIDLMVLDVVLPQVDGITLCRTVRKQSLLPIIMVSGKTSDQDKILGLNAGADDYLVKPFSLMELAARIKSRLRRKDLPVAEAIPEVYRLGEVVVDTTRYQVTRCGERIPLTPTEFAILRLLCQYRGQVFSIQRIYEAIWGDSFFQANNTVMVHMHKLRGKIEAKPHRPELIKTVWGVGYKIDKEE